MPLNMPANLPHRMRPEDNVRLPPRSGFQQLATKILLSALLRPPRLSRHAAILPQHLRSLPLDA